MTADRIRQLLAQVQAGRLNAEEASRRLKTLPYENLGFAAVDHHRVFRQGMAEAIFCEGKTTAQAVAIARRLLRNRHPVLATRVEPALARALLRLDRRARYEPLGRTVVLAPPKGWGTRALRGAGHVVIMTAGTADMSVAEEARVTAQVLGDRVTTLYDVGVAGPHPVLGRSAVLGAARGVGVVGGLARAVPSVVGGVFGQPVIAVPTSRGYGASFGGRSALLAMLNSCAAGVAVVNIDNGYGAACLAHRINALSAS